MRLNCRVGEYYIYIEFVDLLLFNFCVDSVVGGYFNFFFINKINSLFFGIGIYDFYEVGDFSGKYGLVL